MYNNKKIGNFGEKIAINYLKRNGYKIISRNLQISNQELDIIAKIKAKWVFIEVKTCVSEGKNFIADQYMKKNKLDNLKIIINKIIIWQNIPNELVRVDLIAVQINKQEKSAKIKHYFNIL